MHRIGDLCFRSFTSTGLSDAVFVLVHGIGMSHRYLARLHAALSAQGTVISVDLPGFGGLPKPAGDAAIGEMADALGNVLDRLDVSGVVLIGQSMGTQWVVELAVRRPDLARAVVLIGPVADERRRTAMQQARLLALDTMREPPGANTLVMGDYLRCGPFWYLTQLRHMLGYPIEERIASIDAPVLVIRGGRDPIASRSWCRLLRSSAAPDTMLIEVPGRAHNVQHSAPAAVASAISHFCLQLALGRSEGGTA
ncbi:alpha/beta fold hydrolase [Microbacterium esteraromaticum]|uniref:alpha/beta fold hydrolase n=1 Tax=Microbacterium esteraromaticum TaxID=57043 RepID=UPI00195CD069|nr:alpha/beta hydrolase [Microbacterium esteraromaticum]MBM7464513.1 pimeloyl-ACP methyl ester carboxylesterase [Microbacterium esteraromaticum]